MFRPPSIVPELDSVMQQSFFVTDPKQREFMQNEYTKAVQKLQTMDKSNRQEYAMTMEQIVMLDRRLKSNVTQESILNQRISILEGLVSNVVTN
jgi:hypothetical protein